MNHSLFLFSTLTLRQPAAVLARSVFVSEFSDHTCDSRAGNLSAVPASISYQPNRALRPAPDVFTAQPSHRNDSRRVNFSDRSTRNGHKLSNVSLNRTTNMFAPALSELSYLFCR
jgi:hypothetical protein